MAEANESTLIAERKIKMMIGPESVSEINMKATAMVNDGSLEMVTEMAGVITSQVAEFKSDAIRKALIAMGWTPPPSAITFRDLMQLNIRWFLHRRKQDERTATTP